MESGINQSNLGLLLLTPTSLREMQAQVERSREVALAQVKLASAAAEKALRINKHLMGLLDELGDGDDKSVGLLEGTKVELAPVGQSEQLSLHGSTVNDKPENPIKEVFLFFQKNQNANFTTRDVAATLSIELNKVSASVHGLKKRGWLSHNDGKYQITSEGVKGSASVFVSKQVVGWENQKKILDLFEKNRGSRFSSVEIRVFLGMSKSSADGVLKNLIMLGKLKRSMGDDGVYKYELVETDIPASRVGEAMADHAPAGADGVTAETDRGDVVEPITTGTSMLSNSHEETLDDILAKVSEPELGVLRDVLATGGPDAKVVADVLVKHGHQVSALAIEQYRNQSAGIPALGFRSKLVFSYFEKHQNEMVTPYMVSHELNVDRTVINYILKRLHQRGLISKHSYGFFFLGEVSVDKVVADAKLKVVEVLEKSQYKALLISQLASEVNQGHGGFSALSKVLSLAIGELIAEGKVTEKIHTNNSKLLFLADFEMEFDRSSYDGFLDVLQDEFSVTDVVLATKYAFGKSNIEIKLKKLVAHGRLERWVTEEGAYRFRKVAS